MGNTLLSTLHSELAGNSNTAKLYLPSRGLEEWQFVGWGCTSNNCMRCGKLMTWEVNKQLQEVSLSWVGKTMEARQESYLVCFILVVKMTDLFMAVLAFKPKTTLHLTNYIAWPSKVIISDILIYHFWLWSWLGFDKLLQSPNVHLHPELLWIFAKTLQWWWESWTAV